MDNNLLAQTSPRLELQAIANAVWKTMSAYRSKKFDKILAVADPGNDVDFVQEINFCIICLIYVICFVTL